MVAVDGFGVINRVTGDGSFGTPSIPLVYLTAVNPPCPHCVGGVCAGGERNGLACTPANAAGATYDCPPRNSQFFQGFDFAPPAPAGVPLTMGSATLAAADGNFCPNQRTPGAFGKTDARRIVETGSPAGDLRDRQPHAYVVAGIPCIGSGGSSAVDDFADLPGPNGVSTPGTVQLLP
jgi:hypothetical protein